MEPEPLREPSLNELCCLTLSGNIAYAVRCARRMQPRFRLPADAQDADKMTAVVDAAIRWAEVYVATATGDLEHAARLTELARAVSEAVSEQTDYAAYAAYHAVRGASLSANAGATVSDEVYLEVVASAYGASRVLLGNLPLWFRNQALAALRSDYDKIVQLSLGNPPARGELVDATVSGPLGGVVARGYAGVVIFACVSVLAQLWSIMPMR